MKKIYFKEEDLTSLSQLLKANIPLKEAFSLIKNKHNQKLIEHLLEELNSGKSIENLLFNHLKKDLQILLKSFLKVSSFERALYLSLQFKNHKSQIHQKLLKELSYPLLLFVISMTGLSLFQKIALPSLLGMLENFEVDFKTFEMISNGMGFLLESVIYLLMICLFFFLLFQKRRYKRIFFRLLKKCIHRSYFELYQNYEFIYYYDLCSKEGISTKDSLALIRSMKEEPILAYFAYEIDEILNTGKSFEEAILISSLDSHLYIYIKIAIYSGNLKEMIELYLKENEKERTFKINRLIKTMQVLSYGMIGFFVIFIYQVLFLPMQALNQF